MTEHYPKATIQASIWCNACNKQTPHRVADGRRQYCLICYDKPRLPFSKEPEPQQMKFSDVVPDIET